MQMITHDGLTHTTDDTDKCGLAVTSSNGGSPVYLDCGWDETNQKGGK